jgi:hypothetical protein
VLLTVGFIVFLVILIETDVGTNRGMVSLGVSLFIGTSWGYRFNIKTTQSLEVQLLALAKIEHLLKHKEQLGGAQTESEKEEEGHPFE